MNREAFVREFSRCQSKTDLFRLTKMAYLMHGVDAFALVGLDQLSRAEKGADILYYARDPRKSFELSQDVMSELAMWLSQTNMALAGSKT